MAPSLSNDTAPAIVFLSVVYSAYGAAFLLGSPRHQATTDAPPSEPTGENGDM
ncbi:hypothetical protein Mal64_00390 [Pseudobythopirellula maris]|uniref:Uncharacterized protein n=1 Tax=Pseudobythopirellula maris TaxID=2527991 RepID=A0A5C5ZQV8_9BACT|nr:hypothetical protein [Pseudobythopirellula maris]TWT89660.1 hypothetical protein Mal64_00390 [Pseudobythopirellula maris]